MRALKLLAHRGKGAAVAFVLVLALLTGAVLLVAQRGPNPSGAAAREAHATSPTTAPGGAATPGGRPSEGPTRGRDEVVAAQVARLRGLDPVVSTLGTPKITGEATGQPDLYAAEFVRRLLTQDYRRPRRELLEWVQAESATTTEPLVVGKVPPELRDRLAVFSVTDAGGAPTPIPTAGEWDGLALQHAYTTVTIDRVEEPFAWTNAVASGRITDPGVTAREVAATVTRHTSSNGEDTAATFSVAVTLNLEGPPTRRGFGVVAVISYSSIQVS